MPRRSDGAGTLYQRGNIWWVKIRVDGRPVYESSKSDKKSDAIKLRDQMLAKKARGELAGGGAGQALIGDLLDDLLKSDVKATTLYVWRKVVEKNIRPFFGRLKAQRLTTDLMDKYRAKRRAEKRTDSTVNRELSLLRIAFNNGRKRTPPKVLVVPYFPMIAETNIRQGFLSDEQYDALRAELPDELKALFVTGYITGLRLGEIKGIRWEQVDFEAGLITLNKGETKNDRARSVPIIDGEMRDLLMNAKRDRDERWPDSPWVFSREGERILNFRRSWTQACERAGVPDLHFHDLRRTAVRNMRRAGIPQVIRMKISGHLTDSMERRYNIVDNEDMAMAKELLQNRRKIPEKTPKTVTKNVTTRGKKVKPRDKALSKKSAA